MKQILIHIPDENGDAEFEGRKCKTVEIVLRRARVRDGSFRSRLIGTASLKQAPKEGEDGFESFDPQAFEDEQRVAIRVYPNCVACVDSPLWIRDMPLAQFMELDDGEIEGWLKQAYLENVHWVPEFLRPLMAAAEAEKKIGTPDTGSPDSMMPQTTTEPSLPMTN